jgi:hypothetical protein
MADDASRDRPHPLPPQHQMRLDELKDKVDRSDYAVDPRLVAEALLRRFDTRREASGPAPSSNRMLVPAQRAGARATS